jgi:CRISPR-associated protein Cas2
VLEGGISKGDLQRLRGKVEDTLVAGESVIVYELSSDTLLDRIVYGEDPTEDSRFL